jgi:hypothetical protein
MPTPNSIEFERLVRAYLAGNADWDDVHKVAIEMEWANAADFPTQLREPLEALYMAFLTADGKDDPQFRMDRSEIFQLLEDLDRAHSRMPNT